MESCPCKVTYANTANHVPCEQTDACACDLKSSHTMSVPGWQTQVGVVVTARQLTGAVHDRWCARRHPFL